MNRDKAAAIAAKFIAAREGCKLYPYQDGGGVWTIGYGHTQGVTKDTKPISTDTAEHLLLEDIASRLTALISHDPNVYAKLNENQVAALLSFVYNVGMGNYLKSTLYKLLRAGCLSDIPVQMRLWRKDNGKVIQGLINRREAEIALFNSTEGLN